MRYMTDMSEGDIREEIVRLVRQKHIPSHDLQVIQSKDFDFVRCVNKHTKCIDGDVPFDACGITLVYKNGSIYVRLNTSTLPQLPVSQLLVPWLSPNNCHGYPLFNQHGCFRGHPDDCTRFLQACHHLEQQKSGWYFFTCNTKNVNNFI